MPTEFGRTVRFVITTLLVVTLALPALEIRAATDLYPGAPAHVSSLSAPFASIKLAPDPFAAELIQVDNGVPAHILAGPLPGADGLLWYQVDISGVIGYMTEADLAWDMAEETAAPEVEPEPTVPVVTGNGVVISADGSPIGCLAAPAWDARWLFTYSSGSLVDTAGEPLDGWQPVLCASQLGYLPAAIVYNPNDLPAPEPTDVATEIVTTEVTEATESPVDPEPKSATETTATEVLVEETPLPEVTVTNPETEVPAPIETQIVPEDTATTEIVTETPTLQATEPVVRTPEIGQTIPETTEPPVVGRTVAEVIPASIAGTAVVFNTGAGGLRCRSGASLESPVLLVLPLGAAIALTGANSNGWTPVICGEQAGFVASRFLQQSDDHPDGEESVDPSAALTGATGVVQNTDGDGVRCRAAARLTASVITVLSEGTRVSSRGAAVGVWQPVTCAGRAGFVHIDFLGNVSGGGSSGGGTGGGSSTGNAVISGTNGDGVRFRASAGYDGAVIAVLNEGTSVSLRAGSIGSWTAVTYAGRNGFIYADFLSRNSSGGSSGGGSGVGGTNLGAGSNARVTDTLNFRNGASYSAGVIAVAGIGTVVRVTGSPSGGFYPVRWGSVTGYMHGDYLTYTTSALSGGPSNGTGGTGGGAGAGSGSGSASGQAMVNYAMRYIGYPYVWATHGPNSFDCSGFTYWVVINVTGRNIGAGTWSQWGTGAPIQYGNLQPGDLVFFQNTFTVGLSHVGMYIGNDQFIHAENENTGVRISSLTSTYYSTRYLGARRLT